MKLYKYYRPVDYAFANFEKEVLCFNAVSNFSDQMEGAYKMISNVELEGETEVDKMINRAYHALAREMSTVYTDAIRFQYRILSMTDRRDYRYMWNAYAQNGEGFCLEYECADVGQVADGSGFIRYLNQKMADGVFEDAKSTEEDLHKQIWNILFS